MNNTETVHCRVMLKVKQKLYNESYITVINNVIQLYCKVTQCKLSIHFLVL